jgi:ornithine decarboxylase
MLRYERTPLLLIDKRVIQQKYEEFHQEFKETTIYYALKANPDQGILKLLRELGSGFEVSSKEEFESLLQLDISPHKIISSNPVKDQGFIEAAYAGVELFVFDSDAEVEKLSRFAPGSKVCVRLSVSNEGSEWPLNKKFGVEVEEAVELLKRAKMRGLRPEGITFHIGSQCIDPKSWVKAIEKAKVVWRLARDKGLELNILNIGGGFPIEYTKSVPSIREIAPLVQNTIRRLFSKDLEIIVEPGRALVGEAGILVGSVIGKAMREGGKWLYLDVGVFNGLMETIGGIKYPLMVAKDGEVGKWVLAGPSCDSFDVISSEEELPELEIGDRVYIMSAGAYTTAYASRFNGFPIPKTCLV